MIVGMTGTRRGMTDSQVMTLHQLIDRLQPTGWLHGACVGADEDGVVGVRMWAAGVPAEACTAEMQPEPPRDVRVVAMPGVSAHGPENSSLRSEVALKNSDEVRPPKTHFARNRDIVDGCQVLLAFPADMAEQPHGGTWYTINYARKRGRRVVIVWPDGTTNDSEMGK